MSTNNSENFDLIAEVVFLNATTQKEEKHLVDTFNGYISPACFCKKQFSEIFKIEEIFAVSKNHIVKKSSEEGFCQECIRILKMGKIGH